MMEARLVRGLIGGTLASLLLGIAIVLVIRRGWLRMQLRDLIPFLTYCVVFLILYFADGHPLSWSIARGQAAFTVETAIIGALAALAALAVRRIRHVGRGRNVEQAGAIVLLWGVYIWIAAVAGSDPAWLAGPRISFLLIFLSTAEFYAAAMFGLLALFTLKERTSGAKQAVLS
jgi:fucose 4-O-acetylase-like acetyltransferase